jgi:putative ABC transport system permease protein
MMSLLRDTRFGFRLLRKNPGFAAVAILALALGIGANTAIFSVVYATLLAPLPYPQADQLVVVRSTVAGNKNVASAGDFLDWQRENSVFQSMGTATDSDFNLAVGEKPERVQGSFTTAGFLDQLLGEPPFLGRYFGPDEAVAGKDHVVVLTNQMWREHFAGDPRIIGREIHMNGESYTVIGVRPAGQADRTPTKLFVPLVFKPDQINHDFHFLIVFARMKPGVTLAQAIADMNAVTRHIADVYPKSNKGWGASVEPLKNDFLDRDVRTALWLLLGAVAFVLLIACANVANLLMARATTRQKEVAVRASLGASRQRLFSQFLAESIVLAFVGGALGVALAWGLLHVIVAIMPPFTLPSEADVRLNVPVLLFTVVATLFAGVLFGSVPAWQAARMNLNEVLKEGGRSAVGAGRHGFRRTLVIAEFALALSLLAGGGLAIHSLWNVAHVDLGFRTDHILTFQLPMPQGHLTDPQQITTFYRQLLQRIQALPGVTAASASEGIPIEGVNFGMPFQIAGRPNIEDPSARPGAGFSMITPQYFKAFGMSMKQGRCFTDQDVAGSVPVAVVNEAFVKKFLSGVDPLTQTVLVEQLIPGVTKLGPPIPWQIVGVYHDVRNGGPRDVGFPEIDVPFAQSPWPQAVIGVRATVEPATLTRGITEIVQSMDPNLPLSEVKTMDQIKDESLAGDRFTAALFGGFAAVALLLAALGIYGVMSFAVAQRTHEIGLRMALGAGRSNVLTLILKEGMLLAGVGLLLGLAGAYGVGKAMHSIFYNVGTIDFAAFSAVAAALLFAALLACFIPAHRATLVDPMQALREE